MRDQIIHVRLVIPKSLEARDYRRYRLGQRTLVFLVLCLTGFFLDSVWRDTLLTVGVLGLWVLSELQEGILRRAVSAEVVTEFLATEVRSGHLRAPGAGDASLPASQLYN